MNYEASECIHKTVLDALRNFVNLKQNREESITDYSARFKAAKDVLWSHIGQDFQNQIRAAPDYLQVLANPDSTKMDELRDRVVETFLTYLFMSNADQNKYGSLMARFRTDHTLVDGDKLSEYPTTLERAVTVMTNHEWDKAYHENKRKREERKKENPKRIEENSIFAQIGKGRCYCCGKTNHNYEDCTKRLSTPKSEWHINKNKEVQAYQRLAAEIAGVMHTQYNTAANASSSSTDSTNDSSVLVFV